MGDVIDDGSTKVSIGPIRREPSFPWDDDRDAHQGGGTASAHLPDTTEDSDLFSEGGSSRSLDDDPMINQAWRLVCALDLLNGIGIGAFLTEYMPPRESARLHEILSGHARITQHRRTLSVPAAATPSPPAPPASPPQDVAVRKPHIHGALRSMYRSRSSTATNANAVVYQPTLDIVLPTGATVLTLPGGSAGDADPVAVHATYAEWSAVQMATSMERFRKFLSVFAPDNDDHRASLSGLCQTAQPTHREKARYRALCEFLFRPMHLHAKRYTHEACAAIQQAATTIALLRDVEAQPNLSACEGFLYLIDNVLAMMLYRSETRMTKMPSHLRPTVLDRYEGLPLPDADRRSQDIIDAENATLVRDLRDKYGRVAATIASRTFTTLVVLVGVVGVVLLIWQCHSSFGAAVSGPQRVLQATSIVVAQNRISALTGDADTLARLAASRFTSPDALADQLELFPDVSSLFVVDNAGYVTAAAVRNESVVTRPPCTGSAWPCGRLIAPFPSAGTLWTAIVDLPFGGRGYAVVSPINATRRVGAGVPLQALSSSVGSCPNVDVVVMDDAAVVASTLPSALLGGNGTAPPPSASQSSSFRATSGLSLMTAFAIDDFPATYGKRIALLTIGTGAVFVVFCIATVVFAAGRWRAGRGSDDDGSGDAAAAAATVAFVVLVLVPAVVWVAWMEALGAIGGVERDRVVESVAWQAATDVAGLLQASKTVVAEAARAADATAMASVASLWTRSSAFPSAIYVTRPDGFMSGIRVAGQETLTIERSPGASSCYTERNASGGVVVIDCGYKVARASSTRTAYLPTGSGAVYVTSLAYGNGSVSVEFGSDVIVARLRSLMGRVSPNAVGIVLEDTGSGLRLVASTTSDGTAPTADATATSTETIIRHLAMFLLQANANIASVTTSVSSVQRDTLKPLTWAVRLADAANGNDWIVAALVPVSDLSGATDQRHTLTLVIAVFTVVLMLVLDWAGRRSAAGVTATTTTGKRPTSGPGSMLTIMTSIRHRRSGQKRVKYRTASDLKVAIQTTIQEARAADWEYQQQVLRQVDHPISSQLFRRHAWDRARRHIVDGAAGLNVPHICLLEKLPTRVPLRVYRLIQRPVVKWALTVTITVHICLSFAKPATLGDLLAGGATTSVVVAEAVCLVIEALFIGARLATKYIAVRSVRLQADLKWDDHRTIQVKDIGLIVVFAVVVVDWIAIVAGNVSIEYYVPCRPFLYVLSNAGTRESVRLFARTVYDTLDASLLYLLMVVVCGCISLAVFRADVNADQLNSSFTNVVRAISSCFVVMSTAENYHEMQYPAVNAFNVVWIAFMVGAGMFIILGIVIGTFQAAFERQRAAVDIHKRVLARAGMVAAFVLLDYDEDGHMSMGDFHHFLRFMRPAIASEDVDAAVGDLDKKSSLSNEAGSGRPPKRFVDVDGFISGAERVLASTIVQQPVRSAWRANARGLFFENPFYLHVWRLLTIGLIGVVALYGVSDEATTRNLDRTCLAFVVVSALEMLVKVAVYAPSQFWNYSRYNIGRWAAEIQFANRYDAIVVGAAFIGSLAGQAMTGFRFHYTDNENNERFYAALPVVRIVTQTVATRHLIFGTFRVVPVIKDLVVLLLLVMYIYAMVGVQMLAHRFERMLVGAVPPSNFDNLANAFLGLTQLLVSDNWHATMYAAIQVTSWNIALYFMSYMIIVYILLSNLASGVITTVALKYTRGDAHAKTAD